METNRSRKPTFLYFDLYLNTAYYVYFTMFWRTWRKVMIFYRELVDDLLLTSIFLFFLSDFWQIIDSDLGSWPDRGSSLKRINGFEWCHVSFSCTCTGKLKRKQLYTKVVFLFQSFVFPPTSLRRCFHITYKRFFFVNFLSGLRYASWRENTKNFIPTGHNKRYLSIKRCPQYSRAVSI